MSGKIRDEFQITRQGKQYVLYAGLLDEFHRIAREDYPDGTATIETDLIQAPVDNGRSTGEDVAIVHARAGIKQGEAWLFGPFDGIGDASKENVGRNIAPHLIRMAETRAKARALRDAINVNIAIQDDMPDPETEVEVEPDLPTNGNGRALPERECTLEQQTEIRNKAKEYFGDRWNTQLEHSLKAKGYTELSQLTFEEAEHTIRYLEGKIEERNRG